MAKASNVALVRQKQILAVVRRSRFQTKEFTFKLINLGAFECYLKRDPTINFLKTTTGITSNPLVPVDSSPLTGPNVWDQTLSYFSKWLSIIASPEPASSSGTKHENATPEKNVQPEETTRSKSRIFISHSSKDVDMVTAVSNWLELTTNLDSTDIFCTSLASQGVQSGEPIAPRLKTEIQNADVMLYIVTQNFNESPVCIAEMGAGWITHEPQNVILLKSESVAFSDINFTVGDRLIRKLYDLEDLLATLDDLKAVLDLELRPYAKMAAQTAALISKLKTIPLTPY
jgi:hypothetical protein